REGPAEMCPLAHITAVGIKPLHTRVSPVGHIQHRAVERNAVWNLKLTGPGSFASPHLHAFSRGGVLENARVAVPIRYEQPSVRSEGDVGSSTERREGAIRARGDFPYRYL